MIDRQPMVWSLATVIASGVVAFAVSQLRCQSAKDSSASEDFHAWLHQNLQISAQQEEVLHPIETAFEAQLRDQEESIRKAGADLAEAIRQYEADSPQIASALEKLHHTQGQLQRLTLEHFFAMKEHLSAEQGEKLLQWTHDSILYGHHD